MSPSGGTATRSLDATDVGQPLLGDELHRCGHGTSARPVSAVRDRAEVGGGPFSDVGHGLGTGAEGHAGAGSNPRECAQDLSWLCSLPCGNSGRRRPAAVSVAFLGALPRGTSVGRAPRARVEPRAAS